MPPVPAPFFKKAMEKQERFYVDFSQTYFCYLIRDRETKNESGTDKMVMNSNLFDKKLTYEECDRMNNDKDYANQLLEKNEQRKNIQRNQLRRNIGVLS